MFWREKCRPSKWRYFCVDISLVFGPQNDCHLDTWRDRSAKLSLRLLDEASSINPFRFLKSRLIWFLNLFFQSDSQSQLSTKFNHNPSFIDVKQLEKQNTISANKDSYCQTTTTQFGFLFDFSLTEFSRNSSMSKPSQTWQQTKVNQVLTICPWFLYSSVKYSIYMCIIISLALLWWLLAWMQQIIQCESSLPMQSQQHHHEGVRHLISCPWYLQRLHLRGPKHRTGFGLIKVRIHTNAKHRWDINHLFSWLLYWKICMLVISLPSYRGCVVIDRHDLPSHIRVPLASETSSLLFQLESQPKHPGHSTFQSK